MILLEQLNPSESGKWVVLYEHSVFTRGALWAIDSFDQREVELGNKLAQRMIREVGNNTGPLIQHDSSTSSLIQCHRTIRRESS